MQIIYVHVENKRKIEMNSAPQHSRATGVFSSSIYIFISLFPFLLSSAIWLPIFCALVVPLFNLLEKKSFYYFYYFFLIFSFDLLPQRRYSAGQLVFIIMMMIMILISSVLLVHFSHVLMYCPYVFWPIRFAVVEFLRVSC